MFYLLCAIVSSALVSIIMRLSTDKVENNISMLAMNYLMCSTVAAAYAGFGQLFPQTDTLGLTLGMGVFQGILYLLSFILLQVNVKKNGVVLPATFMKLGLLVPMVISILLFREIPAPMQIVGFCIATAAILLINLDKSQSAVSFKIGLVLLLLINGTGDAMAKVYEEIGDPALSAQFLFYTFAIAFILCMGLVAAKKQKVGKNELFYGFLVGVPNYFSAKFLLAALNTVPAVITYPTYSVGTILLVTLTGVGFFKEKLGKKQWIGLGIILVALILLNM
ncbi:MAG: EamA family transporter [Clostridia bacterium]|nr:EamA family transporter [Clostridia bacterium]